LLEGLEAVLVAFRARWEAGETPMAAEYLDQLDPAAPDEAEELIYAEFCAAEAAGLAPDPAEFQARYHAHAEALGRVFKLHGALDQVPADLPVAGDSIGPYRLKRELGQGGFARVFLAEQSDLDNRLVVVKVAPRVSAEGRLLARANHPHIVDILWQGKVAGGTIQLIVMPFLGGATLGAVLRARPFGTARPSSGKELLADLDAVADREYAVTSRSRLARDTIARHSYPRALAWIVARLAEALDHAHQRGVAHGDVKPSNILISADGMPKLLDFNLAVDGGDSPDSDGPAGGTLGYMAPEALRALSEPGAWQRATAADRHRSDLYSLGLVFLEALSGRPPAVPPGPADDRRAQVTALAADRAGKQADALTRSFQAAIPPGLRPILARMLCPVASQRYARGNELAEDLDRWRTDRAPIHVADAAWPHRLLRWSHRRRKAIAAAVLAVAAGFATAAVIWRASERSARAAALDKVATAWDRADSGTYRYRRPGYWQDVTPGDPATDALRHLTGYGVLEAADWRARDDVRTLPEPTRGDLEGWIWEQALRHVQLLRRRQHAPGDWQRALEMSSRLAAATGAGPFAVENGRLRELLRMPPAEGVASGSLRPRIPTWQVEYLEGIEIETDHPEVARDRYRRVLALRPDSYWALYRLSAVAFRMKEYASSAGYLQRCIKRRPLSPALRSQLAGCFYQLNRMDEALEACNQAIALDTGFAEAFRNRAYVRGRLGRTDGLRDDVERLDMLSSGRDRSSLWGFEVGAPFNPAATSANDDPRRIEIDPRDVDLRTFVATQLIWKGQHEDALAELERGIGRDPENLRARYTRGLVALILGRDGAEADLAFVIHHPRFAEFLREEPGALRAYRYLAEVYMNRGQLAEGIRTAERGLARAEATGILEGESHYALAQAYAVAAQARPELIPSVADQLEAAFRAQPSLREDEFAQDPVFEPLRDKLQPRQIASRKDRR
jgi:serine/threonine protein kinase/tetratricopeptide (TPR) repeat protein